ncbi:MAG: Imidazolonepropionase-like amidohydrolase [Acidobacteria bacterium OLB17]|nr:MAG: Imidazolonepropionase-like amidohydrolase [Acidobacteria bacterium OLB17]MCZ2389462.1 amidohydrolase family protein [Acidobacteriota bacterium]
MNKFLSLLLAILLTAAYAAAQEKPTAFVNAKVFPISGPAIEQGVVIIQNGKIVAVGDARTVKLSSAMTVIDAKGKVIMPGIIDSHSHIGNPAGGDSSSPIQPDVRILDSVNPMSASFQRAQSGGITTANVMPGSGHLDSGQTLYLKLRDNVDKIDDLFILDDSGNYMGGIKFANGTNPIRPGGGSFPGTRAKSAALVRDEFIKAREYRDKVAKAAGDASKMPPRDLRMEALVEVLNRKRTVHFHTHRHDDILTVLRLQKEFGFKLVLQHVSDAWAVADEIKKANVPVSIIFLDSPGGKIEAKDIRAENGAILEKAGVLIGFHTDDGITDSRWFLRSAGMAVRAGMSREKALYALTLGNAKILDLDKRIGSLEPGKDADLVILSGDPISVYTHVLETWVEGKKVFDRNDPKDRLIQTGGYGATNDRFMDTDHDDGGQDQ